jgi:ubiquinol-cytochrome c reductase cytochrome c1 subunit
MAGSAIAAAFAYSYSCRKNTEAWLFRDDIGAPYGIKGYEEQVNTVGVDHGHNYWPSEVTFQTYNSAT